MTIEELRTFFFYSLFSWTATFLSPLVISFHDFLVLSFSVLYAFLVYSMCTQLRFTFFNDISLIKKRKGC